MKVSHLVLLLGIFACRAVYAQENTTSAQTTSSLEKSDWNEVVKQAQKEGGLVFNIWYLQPQWRAFVKPFEEEYGIKITIPEGTIDGNMNKLLAESKRETGKMDVMALSVSQLPIIIKANAIRQLTWLPGYESSINYIQSIDTQGYAVAFWGNQTGFAYDPQQIGNTQLPQTLNELQQFIETHPRRFGYNDPNNGGAGEAFIQRIVTLKSGEFDSHAKDIDANVIKGWSKGWSWFVDNKDKLTQTASGADSLTRLNDGELILVPAWEDHLRGLQRSGAITSRLEFYIPQFGMPGGGNVVVMANNSPHPAACAVFINWLIQPSTQLALKETFGTVPMIKEMPETRRNSQAEEVQFYGKEYSMQFRKEFVRNVTMK
ncbi:extracellular solute-binding protein [Proteus myxofaciens]|uniref:Putative periplasmic substrate-binding component of an ABC superfamily transporter n=1 Tax=Proteus myxofaciens ATCC 19692 TaxID=1354337 RepID=A0A198FBD7_9GAMM|nr:extracellular solute-binding protein [Proteus myxofaciens]OAT21586.1 putative periplasmic substrate-binding component of an ABC superfamily transporter [Proteus myxofaciens ATCC 19692]